MSDPGTMSGPVSKAEFRSGSYGRSRIRFCLLRTDLDPGLMTGSDPILVVLKAGFGSGSYYRSRIQFCLLRTDSDPGVMVGARCNFLLTFKGRIRIRVLWSEPDQIVVCF